MGDIADYMVEQMIQDNYQNIPDRPNTREILHRFGDTAVKDTARKLYASGMRNDPRFQAMTIDIMNRPGKLSYKQKNVLITFIMYAEVKRNDS